jgi:hypothetical protein
MNGTFLIAVGAVWTEVRLFPRLKAGADWSACMARTGIGRRHAGGDFWYGEPFTNYWAGHSALPWQELVVTIQYGRDINSCLVRPRTLGLAAHRCVTDRVCRTEPH